MQVYGTLLANNHTITLPPPYEEQAHNLHAYGMLFKEPGTGLPMNILALFAGVVAAVPVAAHASTEEAAALLALLNTSAQVPDERITLLLTVVMTGMFTKVFKEQMELATYPQRYNRGIENLCNALEQSFVDIAQNNAEVTQILKDAGITDHSLEIISINQTHQARMAKVSGQQRNPE